MTDQGAEADPPRRRQDPVELVAGLVVAALCSAAAWIASDYGIGTARRMGAGYFPLALGLIGMGLGLALALRAILRPQARAGGVRLRRLACITAAFLLFAVLIEPAGLMITILVTSFVASLADPESRPLESLALGAGLAVAIWVIFVVLLGLSVPVLPGSR